MDPAVNERGEDRPCVLVVDDERGPRESLRLILGYHFRVMTAENGEQALETLRRDPVDVVTLDLKMPGLSGPESLARMRELDPDIEAVIVTGYGSFESAVEVLRLRAFDYITKPFDAEAILEVVRKAVRRRRLARAQAQGAESLRMPLEALVEDANLLEEAASSRLSYPDRAALGRIREHLAWLREWTRGRGRQVRGPGKSEKGHP